MYSLLAYSYSQKSRVGLRVKKLRKEGYKGFWYTRADYTTVTIMHVVDNNSTAKSLTLWPRRGSETLSHCEDIRHQSSLTKVGDFWDNKGISIWPDPFGGGAYNLIDKHHPGKKALKD